MRLLFLLLLSFTVSFLAYAEDSNKYAGYKIKTITILRDNVFDLSNPKESGRVGRYGNSIHAVTKEGVIKLELLFKEGDFYDPLILEESERNLRKNSYLTEIWMKVTPNDEDKTVDITVHTRDQWSLILGGTFGGTNENTNAGLDFGDKNLLGSGQTLNYRLRSSNSGTTHSFGFEDSTAFDTRYILSLGYDTSKDNDSYQLKFAKPFYSLETKSSHGVEYEQTEDDANHIKRISKKGMVFYGFKGNLGDDDILRTFLKLSSGNLKFQKAGQAVETKQDNLVILEMKFLFNPTEFVTDRYINRFRIDEDIAMGLNLDIAIANRSEMLGSTSSAIGLWTSLSKNFQLRKKDYLLTSFTAKSNDDSFNDRFYEADFQYLWRDFKWQTFALHGNVSYLESAINTFYLGGTEGLRGFKSEEFTGQGKISFNLEDRIFTYESIFYGIFEPGFVIFNDWGNTWKNSVNDKLTGLNASAGVGLRLAIIKAPGVNLIRVDYGFPLTRESAPILTIGMEGFF